MLVWIWSMLFVAGFLLICPTVSMVGIYQMMIDCQIKNEGRKVCRTTARVIYTKERLLRYYKTRDFMGT